MIPRVSIIAHGRFRGNRLLEAVSTHVHQSVFYTNQPRHAEYLASLINADTTMVIVAGGDGTLHEVVNGLMKKEPDLRPPILLIPMGTGNDTARALGASKRLKHVFERIEEQRLVTWDVIRIAYTDLVGEPAERYCVNIADVGIGGHVMSLYNDHLREYPLGIGYLLASFSGFLTSRSRKMTVDTGIQTREGTMLMVTVSNSKWFGNGIGIAPLADPSDGLIDLTLVGDVSPLTYIRYLPRLLRAKTVRDPRIEYLRTRRLTVSSVSEAPLEIDGEYSGSTPITAEIVPKAIRFVV